MLLFSKLRRDEEVDLSWSVTVPPAVMVWIESPPRRADLSVGLKPAETQPLAVASTMPCRWHGSCPSLTRCLLFLHNSALGSFLPGNAKTPERAATPAVDLFLPGVTLLIKTKVCSCYKCKILPFSAEQSTGEQGFRVFLRAALTAHEFCKASRQSWSKGQLGTLSIAQ